MDLLLVMRFDNQSAVVTNAMVALQKAKVKRGAGHDGKEQVPPVCWSRLGSSSTCISALRYTVTRNDKHEEEGRGGGEGIGMPVSRWRMPTQPATLDGLTLTHMCAGMLPAIRSHRHSGIPSSSPTFYS